MPLTTAFLATALALHAPAAPLDARSIFSASHARRSCAVQMVDPITVGVAAFAAGALPPSAVLVAKEREISGLKKANAEANEQLTALRESFVLVMKDMEISTEEADAKLEEMLQMTAREARKSKEELTTLKESYEKQISMLKELVADYSDRMELQQNSMKRNALIVDSTVAERAALNERAELLEKKWRRAKEELEALQKEIEKNPFERFLKIFQT